MLETELAIYASKGLLLLQDFVRKHLIHAITEIDGKLVTNLKVKYSVILADVPSWILDS